MRLWLEIFLALSALCALCALCAPPAGAQAWPAKPVRIVLQFPPGGSTDLVARILGQAVSQSLGQPVIVENKEAAAYADIHRLSADGLRMTTPASSGMSRSTTRSA